MNLTYATPTISGFGDYLNYVNYVTGDLFFTIVNIGIFLLFYMRFSQHNSSLTSLGWSGFLSFIISVLFVALGLVGNYLVISFAVVTAIGMILMYMGGVE